MTSRSKAILITHNGKRLGLHGSLSRALRCLARYPVGAAVIRVEDGALLARRVHRDMAPAIFVHASAWQMGRSN